MKNIKKIDSVISYFFAFTPLAVVIVMLTSYLHASILLGRFPTYANPDPGDLFGYNLYGYIVFSFFMVTIFILPVWIIALIIQAYQNKATNHVKHFIIFVIGSLVLFYLSTTPIMEWFVD